MKKLKNDRNVLKDNNKEILVQNKEEMKCNH
jgi:hypothetical protein